MFIYELSGCGFESSCSHLNAKYFSRATVVIRLSATLSRRPQTSNAPLVGMCNTRRCNLMSAVPVANSEPCQTFKLDLLNSELITLIR